MCLCGLWAAGGGPHFSGSKAKRSGILSSRRPEEITESEYSDLSFASVGCDQTAPYLSQVSGNRDFEANHDMMGTADKMLTLQ